jgi:uncharacterized protein (DUF4415 family)
MSTKPRKSDSTFVDEDDAPAWTDDQIARAVLADGGKVVRAAEGTLTRKAGRPRLAAPKQIVSLRLAPDLIEAYRATGAGWQKRMSDVLLVGAKVFSQKPQMVTAKKAAGQMLTTRPGKGGPRSAKRGRSAPRKSAS